MLRHWFRAALCLALVFQPHFSRAVDLLTQNFEVGHTVNYTNSAFVVATDNYWALSNAVGITLNPNLTGATGVYLTGQDMDDGLPFTTTAPASITFNTFSVTGYTNLRLSLSLAGATSAETVNYVRGLLDTNGDGTYETTVFNFAGNDNSVYTDAGPNALGTLGLGFTTKANIPLATPTALDGILRFRIEVFNDTSGANENVGIDNVIISGTAVSTKVWNTAVTVGSWDTTTPNWVGPTTYANGDNASFGNTASNIAVNVNPSAVSPASTSITNTNAATTYTFTGSAISGPLLKSGDGKAVFTSANLFSSMSVTGGTLETQANASASGAIALSGGSTWKLSTATQAYAGNITVGTGDANIVIDGPGTKTLSGSISLASNLLTVTVNPGAGQLTISNDGNHTSNVSTSSSTGLRIINNSATEVLLSNLGDNFHGNLEINAGIVRNNVNGAFLPNESTVFIGPTATFDMSGQTGGEGLGMIYGQGNLVLPTGGEGGGATTTINWTTAAGGQNRGLTGVISHSGPGTANVVVNMLASNVWVLDGLNTFNGTVTVTSGTLGFKKAANGGLPSSLGAANNGISIGSAGKLKFIGTDAAKATTDRIITVTGDGATIDASGSVPLTLSGGVLTGGFGLILDGFDAGVMSGPIVLGSGNLTKTGSGTWTLSSALNNYSGTTSINGGTLKVSNTSGSATGSGPVVISGSKLLTGSGSVSGTVTVNGRIAPGNNTGSMATGAETWSGGGTYAWQINSASAIFGVGKGIDPGYDWLNINGILSIDALSSNKFNINISGLNISNVSGAVSGFSNVNSYAWVLATASGGIVGFDPAKFALSSSSFTTNNSLGTGTFSLAQGGGANPGTNNDLLLMFTGGGGTPTFAFNPATSLTLNILKGAPTVPTFTVQVDNIGTAAGIASLTATGSATVSPGTTGTISSGGSASITIGTTATLNSNNTNNGVVRVTPNNGIGFERSVSINVGIATAAASLTDRYTFGPSLVADIPTAGSLAGLASRLDPNINGTPGIADNGFDDTVGAEYTGNNAAGIRAGVNTSGGPLRVSMAWRRRTQGEVSEKEGGTAQHPPLSLSQPGLISDVLDLQGIPVGVCYVMQMAYDENRLVPTLSAFFEWEQAASGSIYLATLGPGSDGLLGISQSDPNAADDTWTNAIVGNSGMGGFAVANYQGSWDFFISNGRPGNGHSLAQLLGSWGVDPNEHTVWAVLDHNSQFAAVPEPGTFALLGAGLVGMICVARRRHREEKGGVSARRRKPEEICE